MPIDDYIVRVASWQKIPPRNATTLECSREYLITRFKPWKKFEVAEEALKNERYQIMWVKRMTGTLDPGVSLVKVIVPAFYGRAQGYHVWIMYTADAVLDVKCQELSATKSCAYRYVRSCMNPVQSRNLPVLEL